MCEPRELWALAFCAYQDLARRRCRRTAGAGSKRCDVCPVEKKARGRQEARAEGREKEAPITGVALVADGYLIGWPPGSAQARA